MLTAAPPAVFMLAAERACATLSDSGSLSQWACRMLVRKCECFQGLRAFRSSETAILQCFTGALSAVSDPGLSSLCTSLVRKITFTVSLSILHALHGCVVNLVIQRFITGFL